MKTQRNFLKAVIEQTLQLKNVSKIGEFIDIAQKYVKTNMSYDLIKQYVPSAVNFNTDNLETGTLPGASEKCNGVWLYIQNEEESKEYIAELEQKLSGTTEEAQETEENRSDIKIEILNGSGKSSNLTKLTNALKNSGYTVSKVGNTNSTSKTSIINKANISDGTISDIKEIIGVGTTTKSTSESSTTSITIILGKDYN